MNTVEFQAIVNNGVISLPKDQYSWNGKKIKVILLDDATTENTNVPAEALDRDADFFSTAGLWKNRDDISQESIRAKAWRNNK